MSTRAQRRREEKAKMKLAINKKQQIYRNQVMQESREKMKLHLNENLLVSTNLCKDSVSIISSYIDIYKLLHAD